jgi:hypothetical protein
MDDTDFFADADVPRARVALLLSHFSRLSDEREPWRIAFPLAEVRRECLWYELDAKGT